MIGVGRWGQSLTLVVRSSQSFQIGEAEYLKTAKSAEVTLKNFLEPSLWLLSALVSLRFFLQIRNLGHNKIPQGCIIHYIVTVC